MTSCFNANITLSFGVYRSCYSQNPLLLTTDTLTCVALLLTNFEKDSLDQVLKERIIRCSNKMYPCCPIISFIFQPYISLATIDNNSFITIIYLV